MEQRGASIERACRVVSLHRSMWYYVSKKDDTELEVLLGELADQLPSRGLDEYYGRLIIRMDAKESCEFTESLVYS